jgi:hypothetical protein
MDAAFPRRIWRLSTLAHCCGKHKLQWDFTWQWKLAAFGEDNVLI